MTAPAFSRAPKIAPSILSADFARLGEEVARDRGRGRGLGARRRDGRPFRAEPHPRPRRGRGAPAARQHADGRAPDDRPGRSLSSRPSSQAGADIVTIHAEAGPHLDRSLARIRELGARAGVSLTPSTPPAAVEYVLDRCDLILVMTVNPGFGGQSFLPAQLDKIRDLARDDRRPPDLARGRRRHHPRDRAALPGGRRRRLRRRLRHLRGSGAEAYAANIAALRGAPAARYGTPVDSV